MTTDTCFAPLQGIRVADFSSNMAGPFGTMILAQLGADVIKIEPPQGDDARLWQPFIDGVSSTHRHMGAGKRGIVIDLKKPEGVEVALRLIGSVDVVLQSMRPGVADRIGIGQQAARARNPDILYYDLSAFGDGPLGSKMPGYDPLIQAYSGIMEMTGHDGTAPTRCAPSLIDLGTGQWIAMGVMAAFLARQRGQIIGAIETALVDTAFSVIPHQAMSARATGQRPARLGSGNTLAAPYQCFKASDAYLLIAAPSERLWRALLGVIGAPELAIDPRFSSNSERVCNVKELEVHLNALLSQRHADLWLKELATAGVPATRVAGLEESVVSSIAGERGTFISTDGVDQVRLPWLIDGQPVPWRRPAPKLGEHSAEILRELGYSNSEMEILAANHSIGLYAPQIDPNAASS